MWEPFRRASKAARYRHHHHSNMVRIWDASSLAASRNCNPSFREHFLWDGDCDLGEEWGDVLRPLVPLSSPTHKLSLSEVGTSCDAHVNGEGARKPEACHAVSEKSPAQPKTSAITAYSTTMADPSTPSAPVLGTAVVFDMGGEGSGSLMLQEPSSMSASKDWQKPKGILKKPVVKKSALKATSCETMRSVSRSRPALNKRSVHFADTLEVMEIPLNCRTAPFDWEAKANRDSDRTERQSRWLDRSQEIQWPIDAPEDKKLWSTLMRRRSFICKHRRNKNGICTGSRWYDMACSIVDGRKYWADELPEPKPKPEPRVVEVVDHPVVVVEAPEPKTPSAASGGVFAMMKKAWGNFASMVTSHDDSDDDKRSCTGS